MTSSTQKGIKTPGTDISPANMELSAEKSKFNDGIFVRLSKNNRYICFSSNVWAKLMKQLGTITEAVKNEKILDLELTKESLLQTRPFQEKTYVCFKKNNLYINLDESQWTDFCIQANNLLAFQDKENIPPESTITRYLYITEDQLTKAFFSKSSLKDYTEKQGLPYCLVEEKLKAPDKNELIQLIRAYMTKKMLSDLVTEHCYGCQYNMPGQKDHSCLEEHAEENYHHLVRLTGVDENVTKVAKALGLNPELYKVKEECIAAVLKNVPEDYHCLFRETI